MQYNSWLYLFPFLSGSLILYYLLPVKRRWIGLLFSSLLFYILTMKSLVVVVLFTTATIYLGARVIEQFNETFKLKKKDDDRRQVVLSQKLCREPPGGARRMAGQEEYPL